jgi:thymidylate kinase
MPYAISQLTETQLIVAEEEQGCRFVESLRKFLLNNRFTIVDLDEDAVSLLSFVPLSVVEKHYKYVRAISTDIVIADRI